jgi:glycosyltransferase involved in cell wall biosynthesis
VTILYHHRTFGDGAEGIHIHAMVDAFREQGHRVIVTGLAAQGQPQERGWPDRLKAAMPRQAIDLASLAASGVEYLQAVREIRRARPDLMYVRHSKHGLAAVKAARQCRVPTVLEVNSVFSADRYHQFEPLMFRRAVRRIERQAFEGANGVIAVSTPLADEIRRVTPVEVAVVPNGVDSQRFAPERADREGARARLGIDKRVVVGWSGILRQWHGVDLLVEAVAALPDAVLLVVGDGPARADIEGRAAHLGIGDRLVITGRIPHEEMSDYLAAMDIAVIPDERTGVASPMKLIEYMAMARAVVAPRLPNIEDVMQHDVNGLLFSAADVGDLTGHLHVLVADAARRERLGAQARLDVEREHTWRHNADRVLSLVGASRGATVTSSPRGKGSATR